MSEPVGELPSAIEQARSAERNRSSTPPGRSASSPPGSTGFDLMEFRPAPLAAWCPCAFAPTWDDDEVPQTVEEINELIGSAMK